jgi:ATP-dependent protease HslVU (ClpYQ) peptidase subunit
VPHRSIFRTIGLLGTALTLGSSGSSTTIVGISANNSVYLGADAMVCVDGSNAAGRMCKINVGDNAAAAMAGHLGDAATSFDAATVLRRALLEPGDLLAKVRSFVRLVHGPLQQSLDYGRLHAPTLFASKYAGKKVLQTMFIAVESDRPTMIVSTLRTAEDGGLIADEPKQIGTGQVYVFGESAAIARYQRSTPRLECR